MNNITTKQFKKMFKLTCDDLRYIEDLVTMNKSWAYIAKEMDIDADILETYWTE